MSLAWLEGFIKTNPRITNDKMTTKQVVMEIVEPSTRVDKCRYTQLMLADGLAHAVSQGKPFFFISHTWGCPFEDTVNMVARHFHVSQQMLRVATEVFVWLDIFAVVRKFIKPI